MTSLAAMPAEIPPDEMMVDQYVDYHPIASTSSALSTGGSSPMDYDVIGNVSLHSIIYAFKLIDI